MSDELFRIVDEVSSRDLPLELDPAAGGPVLVGELVVDVLAALIATPQPRVGQWVEVAIRDMRDLRPRVGRVTKVTDEDGAYVTNYLPREPDPAEGTGFGLWVNARAWNPDDDYQVYAVRVLPE
jgi:hypothetical protein